MLTLMWEQQASDFVKTTCATRDSSHGYEHMRDAATLAKRIGDHDYPDRPTVRYLAHLSAWLHDVTDHKYAYENNEDKLNAFLFKTIQHPTEFELCPTWASDIVFKIIPLVSFSKENNALLKGEVINFKQELDNSDDAVEARHVVSDADKILAYDLPRCIHSAMWQYAQRNQGAVIPSNLLKEDVHKHAKEKLFRLKDEFIRTKCGKELAREAHEKFCKDFNNWIMS